MLRIEPSGARLDPAGLRSLARGACAPPKGSPPRLSRDTLERLFALSLLDGEHFDSMHDAAEAVAFAIALDRKHAPVVH